MSEAILLTGKRGMGKSLTAVKHIQKRLKEGRPVATNLNLNLDKLCPPWNETPVYRIPDIPEYLDLESLPLGNPDPTDEANNGLVVLDECVNFLNSREWNAKDRQKLISWFAQSRKRGWDLIFIAQGAGMVDTQVRNSLCDLLGVAKRTDKIAIPFLSWFLEHTFDIKIRMPKLHVVTYHMGFAGNSPRAYVETHGGANLYQCYDTLQKINPLCRTETTQVYGSALATMLSPYYLRGRYMGKLKMYGKIALTMFIFGIIAGSGSLYVYDHYIYKNPDITNAIASSKADEFKPEPQTVTGSIHLSNGTNIHLSDSQDLFSTEQKTDATGTYYKANGHWYKVQ